MSYQIFVQPQPQNGYQAIVLGLADCMAEGHTEDEAVGSVKAALRQRLAQGKVITVELENESTENPWLKLAGKYQDDPLWDDFQANMSAYRQELNEAEASQPTASTTAMP